MTRINTVEPSELCNQHLFAEWREMPRVVKNLHTSLNRKSKPFSLSEIPPEYILGAGHVKFFFDKFEYLHKRHQKITEELLVRGYELSHTDSSVFTTVPKRFYGDYTPTPKAISLNRQRIMERMPEKPRWKKV